MLCIDGRAGTKDVCIDFVSLAPVVGGGTERSRSSSLVVSLQVVYRGRFKRLDVMEAM